MLHGKSTANTMQPSQDGKDLAPRDDKEFCKVRFLHEHAFTHVKSKRTTGERAPSKQVQSRCDNMFGFLDVETTEDVEKEDLPTLCLSAPLSELTFPEGFKPPVRKVHFGPCRYM